MPGSVLGIYGSQSSGGYHADVNDYQTRVTSAGGTISTSALNGLNTFVNWCYSNGLRDSGGTNHTIQWLWVPATDGFSGCLEKFWYPSGTLSACVNHDNFTASNYALSTGLTGNSWANLATDYNPSVQLVGTSVHFSLYVRSTEGVTDGFGIFGIDENNLPSRLAIHPKWNDGVTYQDTLSTRNANTGFSGGLITTNSVTSPSASVQAWFKDILKSESNAAPSQDVSVLNVNLRLFAVGKPGGINNRSPRSIGGASLGKGIPPSLVAEYSNQWQTLCAAIHTSRAV